MDIKGFFIKTKDGDLGGKINLSILPNGIDEENGGVKVKFSLLIGLNIDKDAVFNDNYKNGFDFIKGIGNILNCSMDKLSLNISKMKLFDKEESLFNWKHYRRWNRLLNENNFIMGHKRSINSYSSIKAISERIIEARNNPLMPITKEISDRIAEFRKNSLMPITKTNKTTFEMLIDSNSDGTNIDLEIQKNDSKYDSINYAGQHDAFQFQGHQEAFAKSRFANHKNLINIINGIYQHPAMAEYYGLIYNFTIDKNELTPDYFNNKDELPVFLYLQSDPNNYFQTTQKAKKPENIERKLLDAIKISTKTKDGKYYHGLRNFGIISNAELDFEFATISNSNDLQSRKLISDEKAKIIEQNGVLIDFSFTKRTVTEGIYLNQVRKCTTPNDPNTCEPLRDLDELCNNAIAIEDEKGNPGKVLNIGLLGQSINTIVNTNKEKRVFSLCKREAIYAPKGWFNTIHKVEEGWLHTSLAVNGTTNPYHPQTIFHWTGDNLCVHKSETQAHKDQKLTSDEQDQAGAAEGTFNFGTKYDEKNSEDRGYTFDYKHIQGADTQLVEGNEYSFILKQVLSNGYTFPLTSNNQFELSLSDLLKNNSLSDEFFFAFGKFSLDDDSINPPVLVANKIFEGKGNKNPESSSHLIISDSKSNCQRFVFPPIIEAQFAKYLGLLSKERLDVNNKEEYKSIGKKIFERAKEKIPGHSNKNNVAYLPDIRGQQMVISPANWFTRWLLINSKLNLQLEQDNYFDFSEKKSDFKNLQAGRLTINPADKFQWKIVDKNSIQINLPVGLQMSFYFQLQENLKVKSNFLKNSDFFNFKNLLQTKGILLSEHNHPKYAKGKFFITRAVAKPDKPIISEVSSVTRPTKASDLKKIFYTFLLKNSFPYLQTVKQLQIKSTFTILTDDSKSIPDTNSKNVKEKISAWQSSNKNFDLLNNEYPSSILEKEIQQTETEVYKNNFGFSIKLDASFLDDLKLQAGDNIIHFNAGNNFDIYLRYDAGTKCKLFCSDISGKPDISNIDLTEETKITVSFALYSNPSEFGCTIFSDSLTTNQSFGYISGKVPYLDLCEKNISLLPRIEQKLLVVEEPSNTNQVFKFEHNGDFFVYRAESTTCSYIKSIQISAISRFQDYYPELKVSELISDPSDEIKLDINNNSKPSLPVFEITPLIFHHIEMSGNNDDRKRSMQLMFEIDRPLQNDEMFALILSDDGKITPFTSAIGRDLTTFNLIDFADAGTPNGFSIDRFILNNSEPKYLPKYFSESSFDKSAKVLTDTKFKILPLIPHFEKEKNKWIAVLALDQEKLRANKLNAYNPFIKIIAVIYNPNSTISNYSSEFTKPKYINLITERFVSVVFSEGRQSFWNIEIKNIGQVKMDNKKNKRSVFIACLREKSIYGINGDLVKSSLRSTDHEIESHYFHMFQNKLSIQFQKNKSLAIYEFETFDNIIESNNANWLQESKARMIYAEDF